MHVTIKWRGISTLTGMTQTSIELSSNFRILQTVTWRRNSNLRGRKKTPLPFQFNLFSFVCPLEALVPARCPHHHCVERIVVSVDSIGGYFARGCTTSVIDFCFAKCRSMASWKSKVARHICHRSTDYLRVKLHIMDFLSQNVNKSSVFNWNNWNWVSRFVRVPPPPPSLSAYQ